MFKGISLKTQVDNSPTFVDPSHFPSVTPTTSRWELDRPFVFVSEFFSNLLSPQILFHFQGGGQFLVVLRDQVDVGVLKTRWLNQFCGLAVLCTLVFRSGKHKHTACLIHSPTSSPSITANFTMAGINYSISHSNHSVYTIKGLLLKWNDFLSFSLSFKQSKITKFSCRILGGRVIWAMHKRKFAFFSDDFS